jgi:hypothetical protein
VLDQAGVRRIRLHDTRHTRATLVAAGRTHPNTILAILGHSQIAVPMKLYTHVTTEDQHAAVGLVGGFPDRHLGVEEVTVPVAAAQAPQKRGNGHFRVTETSFGVRHADKRGP